MQEMDDQFADFYFLTPGLLERTGGIWPIRAGRNIAKGNYRSGPKQIECYSLHFIVRGELELTAADEKHRFAAGDLLCFYPRLTYYYRTVSKEEEPLQMRWIAFQGPQAEMMLQEIGLTPLRPYLRNVVDQQVQTTLDHLLAGFHGAERMQAGGTMQSLSLMYRLLGQLAAGNRGGGDVVRDWVLQCKEYIDLHYTEHITVESVAERAGVHRSYFSARFAEKIGMPPLHYMQRLRMSKGAAMLAETALSVSEIARSPGFPDLFAFTRAFRNYYGIAPTAYRSGAALPDRAGPVPPPG